VALAGWVLTVGAVSLGADILDQYEAWRAAAK
jgi:hypothetical protein